MRALTSELIESEKEFKLSLFKQKKMFGYYCQIDIHNKDNEYFGSYKVSKKYYERMKEFILRKDEDETGKKEKEN